MTPPGGGQLYSLRSKLMLMAAFVVIFPLLLATIFTFFSLKEQIDRSLSRELNAGLGACRLYYQGVQERLEMLTRATANDNTCKTTLRLGVLPQLQKQVSLLAQEYRLDFLLATDLAGKVVAIHPPDEEGAHDLARHLLILEALAGRTATAARRETAPLLAPTAAGEAERQSGVLMLESAAPIAIRETKIGAIMAGIRLSDNQALMTAMQQASGADRTALLMDGVLVASSHQPQQDRPLARLLSSFPESTAASDPAFITCPLDNTRKAVKWIRLAGFGDEAVATLVAFLDYDRAGVLINVAGQRILAVFLAGMLLAALIAFFVARSIAAPVNALSQAMHHMEAGELAPTPLPVERKDELGSLVHGFNSMTARLKSHLLSLEKEIDERVRAEQQLADEKEQLAVTLRSIGDAVMTTDTRGRVLLINTVAEELTGWSNLEAQGRDSDEIFRIVSEKSGLPATNPVRQVLETGRIVALANHTALIARDGTRRSIADSGAPILDRNGNIIGVVVVFRDITHELKLANELTKIKQLESLGVLAGGIAHDFNNILSAILGNIEMTSHLVADRDTRAASLLGEAQKAVLRAVSLTKQLLTFSRGGDPVKDSTSLPALIRDSADFVLRGSQVSCEYRFPPHLWMAEVDSGQISQVIQNIIINAKQAMPHGGTVIISGDNIADPATEPLINTRTGPFVKITIEDSGVGIPPEILDRIFDPYYTTKAGGSGLGLAICHSIVRKHDGLLSVQSRPGHGTTFTIHLPATPTAGLPAQTPDATTPGHTTRPARILVMDDEEMASSSPAATPTTRSWPTTAPTASAPP